MSRTPGGTAIRLALRGSWRSSLTWGGLFALVAVAVVSAYEAAYPTEAERRAVAMLIEGNKAFEALIGKALALDTPGGFAAWRAGGPIMLIAAGAAILATTRLLRGEEDSGRWEQLVAGALTPGRATMLTLAGYAITIAGVGLLAFGGFAAAGLPLAGSALLGTTVALVMTAFAAVGALAAELAPSRRRAAGMAAAVIGVTLLVRVLADGTDSLGALRGWTPFGWAELVHPYSDARPIWLVPLAIWTLVLGAGAVALATRRDLGAGWIRADEARRASMRSLGSTTGFTVRSSVRPTLAWVVAVGIFSAVLGALAADIVSFLESSDAIRRFASGLGIAAFGGARGFLGVVFTFLALPASLAAVYRLGAARDEEASHRLDLMLAGAVPRTRWLLGWAIVAIATGTIVAVAAAALAWVTTVLGGGELTLVESLRGGLNVLPSVVVYVGVCTALFALVPRWSIAATVGAIGAAQILALLAAQDAVPAWLGDLSPFSHLRPVPAVGADLGAALAMVLIGVTATVIGLAGFARRDIVGE